MSTTIKSDKLRVNNSVATGGSANQIGDVRRSENGDFQQTDKKNVQSRVNIKDYV